MLKGWFNLHLLADLSAAKRYFEQALALAQEIHNVATVAFANYGLGYVSYYEGEFEDAYREFQRLALDIQGLGFPAFAVESLCMAAMCSLLLGDPQRFGGIVAALKNPELSRGVEARIVMARVLEALEHFLHGKREESDALFHEALQLAKKGFVGEEALPRFAYGVILRVIRRDEEATEHLARAAELLQTYHRQAELATLEERERRLRETLLRASTP